MARRGPMHHTGCGRSPLGMVAQIIMKREHEPHIQFIITRTAASK